MKKLVALGLALTLSSSLAGFVRVAHLSPDAPNVDVWLNGARVPALTNVPFKAVSGYLNIPAGRHNVAVYVAGQSRNPVISVRGLRVGNGHYTVAAIGQVSNRTLRAKVFVDSVATQRNRATVRVIHASPDAPAVDIAPRGGTALIRGLRFPNATAYLRLPGGTYNLEVRAAGTRTVALDLPGLRLNNGRSYTVFAVGKLADRTLSAVVVENRR